MPCSPSFFSSAGLLRLVELHRLGVAVGEEGQAVDAEDLPLVLEVDQQHLADLRLAALHRALDLGRLEQRGVGVHRDLQLAAGRLVDVVGELDQVLGVEVGRRVGGRQVPLGLGRGGGGDGRAPGARRRRATAEAGLMGTSPSVGRGQGREHTAGRRHAVRAIARRVRRSRATFRARRRRHADRVLGVLMLETRFPRLPGDIGNPATFAFPVRYARRRRRVAAARRARARPGAARSRSSTRRARSSATGRRGDHDQLRLPGAVPARAAGALPVPVWTSSLLLVPELQAAAAGAASAWSRSTPRRSAPTHLRAAGADAGDADRRRRARLRLAAHAARRPRRRSTPAQAERDVVAAGRSAWSRAARTSPRSCSNAPTCRPTPTRCARATGLPVHDITTLLDARWLARAFRRNRHARRIDDRSTPRALAVLDRPRRHLHRHRRRAARRHARHAQAALGEPRAVPRRRGRRHPPPARPRRRTSRSRPSGSSA